MSLEVHQIPVLQDNYVYAVSFGMEPEVAIVDPAVAGPVVEFCEQRGYKVGQIWNTHHHSDHIGANLELKSKYNCQIRGYGPSPKQITRILFLDSNDKP